MENDISSLGILSELCITVHLTHQNGERKIELTEIDGEFLFYFVRM
jgi:hypothetical protein